MRQLGLRKRPRRATAPLRHGVYLLPNLLTTGGLFAGFYSVIATLGGRYQVAAIAILVAHLLDGLDGRIARITKSSSRFGVEYDSLADLVAFGVAPGVLVYQWALVPWGRLGWLAAALYVACGALRLARFNVQAGSVEKRRFVGLPIPAAADVVAALVLVYYFFGGEGATHKHAILLGVTYTLAALMVSTLPYLSFKEMRMSGRHPFWLLLAGVVCIKLLLAAPPLFLFGGALAYTLSGPALWAVERVRATRQRPAPVILRFHRFHRRRPRRAAPEGLTSRRASDMDEV